MVKSHAYQTKYFTFLIIRSIFGNFVFDFGIMYFGLPAYLWNYFTAVVGNP